MREVLISVSLVKCFAAILCFVTFVEATHITNGPAFNKNLVGKHGISDGKSLMSEGEYNVLEKRQIGQGWRNVQDTLFHGRKHARSYLQERFKKESDDPRGENDPGLSKRDFFFTPASPYGQMMNPIDRKMFLVHRGERGSLNKKFLYYLFCLL